MGEILRPPFDSHPELTGHRVVLRAARLSDLSTLTPITVYDGVVARHVGQARMILEKIDGDYRRGETVHWVIAHRETDTPLGTCGFYRGFPDGRGEIGYVLHHDARGHGYMTEAVGLTVRFGHETLGLERIVAFVSPENAASIAVLRRCGFERVAASESFLEYVHRTHKP